MHEARPEIERKVLELAIQESHSPSATLSLDSQFLADFGLDSLGFVNVVEGLEQAFQITIPDQEILKSPWTPRGLVEVVVHRLNVRDRV